MLRFVKRLVAEWGHIVTASRIAEKEAELQELAYWQWGHSPSKEHPLLIDLKVKIESVFPETSTGSPTKPPTTPAPTPPPGAPTLAPTAPTPAPTTAGTEGGSGGGTSPILIVLVIIVLLVAAAGVYWYTQQQGQFPPISGGAASGQSPTEENEMAAR